MRNHVTRWSLAALLLLSAVPAFSQGTVLGWGQPLRRPQSGTVKVPTLYPNIVGGIVLADSSAYPATMNSAGRLLIEDGNRDRDQSQPLSLFSSVVLNAAATYQMVEPVYVGQYSRGTLLLRYACATADTDSVRIGIRIWGKTASGSGSYHLWTPIAGGGNAVNDTCFITGGVSADSTAGTIGRPLQALSFYVCRANNPGALNPLVNASVTGWLYNAPSAALTSGTRVKVRKVPWSCVRFGGYNGIEIELSDNAGNPAQFPYIFVEIVNLSLGAALTSVSCDFWPRVW